MSAGHTSNCGRGQRLCRWSQSEWVQGWPPGGEAAGSYVALDFEGILTAGIDREAVAEVLADETLRQLVEEQVPAPQIALLILREARHNEAVTDVEVELVARPSARCVGVQPRVRYDTKLWMRDLMEGAAYLPK
jgi:hypothetical protein